MLKKNNKRKGWGRRGSLVDLFFYGGLILFAGMIILIGFKIASEFNTQIQANDNMPAESKAATNTLTSYYPTVVDNSFLFLAIGLGIVTLVLAALVRVHPVFIAFFFIGLLFVIVFCGIMSNIYTGMAESPVLSAEADQLVWISNILDKLPLIVGLFGILLMVVMYKAWSAEATV